jgi:hypothetical protein
MNYVKKLFYRRAVKKGFKGDFEEYLEDVEKRNSYWGRSQKRVKGAFIVYEKCLDCGTTERPHYVKGRCRVCFEKTRRAYKLKNYYDNLARKNKLSKRAKKIRDS